MAVAAMSRLELFGLRADLPRIITLLQEAEAVEIEPAESESSTLVEPPAVSALERQIGDLERILAFFDRVAPRRANLIEQFAGVKTILTEREFMTLAADAQAAERLSERVRAVEAGMAEIAARLHEERAMQAQLEPWSGLPLTRADLNGTRHVQIVLGLVPADRYADFVPALRAAEPRSLAAAVAGDGESVRTVIFWPRDAELAKVLADLPFNPISLPDFPDRVDEALAARAAWIHELQGKAAELAAEAARLAAERPRFEARLDYLRNEWAKLNAMRNLAETRHTFRLSGWIPTSRIEELRRTLDRGTQAYALATRPPLPEETVPVVMRNPGPIVPFEALIQGFSYPKYGEIDPTAVTAPFFFLFFGFCLADVGYGLTLILFCLALLRWLKMGPVGKKLAKLFIFGGIGAILMGVVTGSIFGDLIRIKAIINPIENALVLLGLALALGVIQLFLGTALSALPSLRQGQWRDAFFNQGMWLLFLSSVMLLLGKGALGLDRYGRLINYLALGAALGVVYSATRGKRGIVGKLLGIPAGLFNIYNSIGFFSDILSYSRLMALGLSGGVMAMIINLFARMAAGAGGPWIVLGVLIGVFGHGLNVALGILGAYVHSSRLQFLEFYGKFFEGGGRAFKPLRVERKHTFVVKEKEAV